MLEPLSTAGSKEYALWSVVDDDKMDEAVSKIMGTLRKMKNRARVERLNMHDLCQDIIDNLTILEGQVHTTRTFIQGIRNNQASALAEMSVQTATGVRERIRRMLVLSAECADEVGFVADKDPTIENPMEA